MWNKLRSISSLGQNLAWKFCIVYSEIILRRNHDESLKKRTGRRQAKSFGWFKTWKNLSFRICWILKTRQWIIFKGLFGKEKFIVRIEKMKDKNWTESENVVLTGYGRSFDKAPMKLFPKLLSFPWKTIPYKIDRGGCFRGICH